MKYLRYTNCEWKDARFKGEGKLLDYSFNTATNYDNTADILLFDNEYTNPGVKGMLGNLVISYFIKSLYPVDTVQTRHQLVGVLDQLFRGYTKPYDRKIVVVNPISKGNGKSTFNVEYQIIFNISKVPASEIMESLREVLLNPIHPIECRTEVEAAKCIGSNVVSPLRE